MRHPTFGFATTQHGSEYVSNDLRWSESYTRRLTFDSATAQDGNEHVSAIAPLHFRATQLAFGELSLLSRTQSCSDPRPDSHRCEGSVGRRRSSSGVLLFGTACHACGSISHAPDCVVRGRARGLAAVGETHDVCS
jgi:hypothetical protein